ncbi:MAG TPA: cell division ATP-binding protein FtsE [Peptococcaceae bacterium]|jgi:cell division transport system ATP-binding protein|nr:cell division ATP-binding protein FtsE [Clostridia bacterium]HOB82056.1 cell division ATP-binding protein FtsE [Peptococcaceae bacterium]HPZ71604.1 cell division ATP-binding protein FtsE [Peptococcaceae bacterium]HQD54164.1 cell division ATP-binding protein FtsE [Peptococcaceae bacterium]
MIQFFNVSKTFYGEVKVEALIDINLHIKKGEFVFLVGPSGAGKSTLTRLLIREELPTKGQLLVEDRSLLRMKGKEIAYYRRKIGFVFQDFRLLMNRTVYENVAFAMEAIEMPAAEIRERVPAILEMVGLKDKLHAYPHQLSGGQQQRVCIARAVVNDPKIIIADEPTGNLDPDNSWEVMTLFRAINKRGTTVIIATHDRDMVNLMKKRVVALSNGRIVRDEERGEY